VNLILEKNFHNREASMDTHQMEWNKKVAKEIIENLKKRRMEGS
jgi:hypothetical protein